MHTRIFFDILSRRGIDCIDLQYKIYESKYEHSKIVWKEIFLFTNPYYKEGVIVSVKESWNYFQELYFTLLEILP